MPNHTDGLSESHFREVVHDITIALKKNKSKKNAGGYQASILSISCAFKPINN